MTLEHLTPLVSGGTNEQWNLALACYQCNNARGASLEFDPPWAVGTTETCFTSYSASS